MPVEDVAAGGVEGEGFEVVEELWAELVSGIVKA